MVEREVIVKEKIKYAGLGNFKDSYKYAHDWLKGGGFNVSEDNYSEKLSGNSKEIEIVWKANRKMTDYFRAVLDIRWRVLGMTDVEVEVDGKKKQMNKFAELGIEIKGTLEKDYSSKWEVSPFYKFIKDVYNKYVIPTRTEQKEDDIRDIVSAFKDEMKAFFDLRGIR